MCSKDSMRAQNQSLNQKTVIHSRTRMFEPHLWRIKDVANFEKCAGRCG